MGSGVSSHCYGDCGSKQEKLKVYNRVLNSHIAFVQPSLTPDGLVSIPFIKFYAGFCMRYPRWLESSQSADDFEQIIDRLNTQIKRLLEDYDREFIRRLVASTSLQEIEARVKAELASGLGDEADLCFQLIREQLGVLNQRSSKTGLEWSLHLEPAASTTTTPSATATTPTSASTSLPSSASALPVPSSPRPLLKIPTLLVKFRHKT
eukprot:gnl/Spiro4/6525_TR3351_c0_g1_i1.p1 gnl/Spiro4/6525_TR3351_c0_g1~~gnl/Spiro4/6525_TR3351_c0_g1_i1.p1  ORF type:complete len:229 (+),score=65.64 gnl/Spiro4/6525_TR3351_c0_g1_i1:68-688(+)